VAAAGAQAVDRDPWLRLFSALANLELGDLAAAESDLARCAAAWPDQAEQDLVSFRQLVVSAHALACGRRPVPQPPDAADLETGGALGLEAWVRLDRGLALIDEGDRAAARHELATADQLAREQGLDYLVMHGLAALGAVSALDGDYAGMETACTEALAMADRGSWQTSPWLSAGHAMVGLARLMHLDPGAAVEISEQVAEAESPAVRFMAGVVAGAAQFDQGHRVAGLRKLGSVRRELGAAAVPRPLAAIAALIEHHCTMLLAEYPLAREITEWAATHSGITAESHLMVARTAFARGEGTTAERALREALADASPCQVRMTQIECRLLEAAVSIHAGRRTQARSALSKALSLAEPGAIIRPFAHADHAVRALLLDQIGGFGDSDAFACRVRRVLAEVDGGCANGVLTEREHAVLARLTSPQPLDEVASDLLVSVNTVKTHVRAIYAKLGVNNRRAAVVAARELGLT
jgi:LuxR family maltose regulon positive regulatory protein